MIVTDDIRAEVIVKIKQSFSVDGVDELTVTALYVDGMRSEGQTITAVAARDKLVCVFAEFSRLLEFLFERPDRIV